MSELFLAILLAMLFLITGCAPRECFLPDSKYTCNPFEMVSQ